MGDGRVQLAGSAPRQLEDTSWSACSPDKKLDVSVTLRRRAAAAALFSSGSQLSREEAEEALSADPQDIAAVQNFARQHGLTVVSTEAATRTIHLEGSAEQMSEAFGVEIGNAQPPNGQSFMSYQGPITIPEALDGVVTAVLGLDQRPVAQAR